MLQYAWCFIFWYIVGGILPALYIGKRKGLDLRVEGSGNPGARNAGRVLGKRMFFVVLLLDAIKGALPVLVSRSFGWDPAEQLLMLGAVMVGHCYPAVHRFSGGKGAASLAGGLLIFQPLLLIPVFLSAAAVYIWSRRKTAAAVVSMISIVPAVVVWYDVPAGVISGCLVAVLLLTHRSYWIPSQGRM